MALLSENIKALLEAQYKHEKLNELRYRARASWADAAGLDNTAKFFEKEADGESDHAKKVLRYINDRNVQAVLNPLSYDEECPNAFVDLFTTALLIERDTTSRLIEISAKAFAENDYQTFYWVSDLINEQTEEENLYTTILDRMKITQDIHLLDVWIGSLA